MFDMQGNSSFEVRNHSKGRDYMEVQLNKKVLIEIRGGQV